MERTEDDNLKGQRGSFIAEQSSISRSTDKPAG